MLKKKHNDDGAFPYYKAGLGANGQSQHPDIDYDDTFSLIVKLATIRMVLSIIVSYQWIIYQMDVKNAFLYNNLQEIVYMQQTLGF